MYCDDNILKAAADGSREAFKIIVENYQSMVITICYNVLKDYQEAENAAQETFIQVYKSLGTYEFKGFKTWLGRIAINKAIDIKRRKVKKDEYNIISMEEHSLNITDSNTLEEEVIKAEDSRKVREMCLRLPDIYSTIIHKYYLQSKSYEEIAREEGISVKTVETRLYRARKKLRESWEEGG